MKDIKTLLYCPICNSQHSKQDIKLVSDNGKAFLVHIVCKKCKNSSLALFSKQGMEKIVTMGVLTDLNYQEACEISKNNPINADEVLDVYKLLNSI